MMRWTLPAARFDLPVAARVAAARGLAAPEAFLRPPDYTRDLHDPFLFRDMEKAVTRLVTAVGRGETVAVYGDYDADGVTATTLLAGALAFAGVARVLPQLPHRLHDGYGMMPPGVGKAAEAGATLIVTVDNGISSVEAVAEAASRGIDVIVTDHHQPPPVLPAAYAIIDPWTPGETYPDRTLAGVGLAWKLATALFSRLPGLTGGEAWGKWALDLVALGTIADVAPLSGENRALVHFGLVAARKTRRPGLRALAAAARLALPALDTESVAFQLAPRLNAAGRLEAAGLAFELLSTDDEAEAVRLAGELQALNQARQGLVAKALVEAEPEARRQAQAGERALVVAGREWHPGIVGLVAGKLCETWRLPAVAMTAAGDETRYVASCRSLPGFDVAAALESLASLLTRHGGHELAGGFTLPAENRLLFTERFLSLAHEALVGVDLEPTLAIDALVTAGECTVETARALAAFAPCGAGNPEPLLVLPGAAIAETRIVGSDGRHLQLKVTGPEGKIGGIWFGGGPQAGLLRPGTPVDLAFSLRLDDWNGTPQPKLFVKDARPAQAV